MIFNYIFHSLEVGQQVSVDVSATTSMPELFRVIIGSKGILDHKDMAVGGKATISFLATPDMAPSAKLIVYSILQSGEIIFKQTELKFKRFDVSWRTFLNL